VDDIRGWDFVDNDNDPMDYNHHGTHVAGTIAAVGNNSLGVTGVCWTAKIMPIRGLDAVGSGWTSNFILAIEYANANGAHVINNSWGGGGYSQPLKDAIDASTAVVVCAAGNSGVDNDITPHYPSSYTSTNIISVAATDQDDDIASFSCYGVTSVDVGAPGTNIYSTSIARHDVFSDDCSGLGNWTTGGTSAWGVESGYLTESPGGNYADNTNSWISTTIPISLAGETGIRLEFQLQGISESDWDFLYIDTSSDGSTWTNYGRIHGSTGGQWFPMEYDINTYAGNQVYIRFRFTSDSIVNYDGWHIDDVKVTAYTDTTHNSYEYLNGTSMAAPIVSGIAGLIKATTPTITNTEIKAAIEQNVDSKASLSGLVATGGRVNANNIFATAPSSLTATAVSASQINLTWTDNSSNEDGFRIERKTGAGGAWSQVDTVTANTTTYSNTGLSELTHYYYRVCAHKTGVNSPSNENDAITHIVAPSSLDASSFSSSEIDLTWTDNSNVETGFRIERATSSGGSFAEIATVGANITTYRDATLPNPSTPYYYRVRAYNLPNYSNYSNEANATTLTADAPSGLTATAVSASRIDLTWTDNSNIETGFRIERKTGLGGTYAEIGSVGLDVETYSDTGLSASTEYFYRVISFNGGGDLEQSNEASATTPAAATPAATSSGGGGGGICFISTATSGL
ncbi:MAG: S8 family serine peptidase, partial [Deltaproteobacteria bacterium]|nr:S8 family serine peptidase [Deltaproteobacteria bacterium]